MADTGTNDTTVAAGQTRRRLRTRAALLAAARDLLAEGREDASIKEITTRARVGFGSFFNHFPGGKDELWFAAAMEVLDEYAALLATAAADVDDPAERFARSFRLTGRLALSQPDLLAPVLARGTELLFLEGGVRAAAIADIAAGVESGRFVDLDPEVHLVVVGGALLGLVRMLATEPGKASPEVVDAVAASALRMLGLNSTAAQEMCAQPLDGAAAQPEASRAADEEAAS